MDTFQTPNLITYSLDQKTHHESTDQRIYEFWISFYKFAFVRESKNQSNCLSLLQNPICYSLKINKTIFAEKSQDWVFDPMNKLQDWTIDP